MVPKASALVRGPRSGSAGTHTGGPPLHDAFLRKRESTTRRRPMRTGGLHRAAGTHPDLASTATLGLDIHRAETHVSAPEQQLVTKVFPLRYETVTSQQAYRNRLRVRFRLNRAPADGTVPPSRFHRSGRSFLRVSLGGVSWLSPRRTYLLT